MDESQRTAVMNGVPVNAIAHQIVTSLPDEVQVPMYHEGRYCGSSINPEYMPVLADVLQAVVADVVASLIDAGSERDAVNENEQLNAALLAELREWGPPPEEA